MDPFAVTVRELNAWLADKPADARVVITPPAGPSFPLLGWCVSADDAVIVLTGAEDSYDTQPSQ